MRVQAYALFSRRDGFLSRLSNSDMDIMRKATTRKVPDAPGLVGSAVGFHGKMGGVQHAYIRPPAPEYAG
jgi:hypothetical protein